MENLNDNQEQIVPKRKAFDKVVKGPNDMEKAIIGRANMGQNTNLIAAHFQMPVEQVKEILAKY